MTSARDDVVRRSVFRSVDSTAYYPFLLFHYPTYSSIPITSFHSLFTSNSSGLDWIGLDWIWIGYPQFSSDFNVCVSCCIHIRPSCCQEMNFFCRNMTEESSPSQHDIFRCPFLRNINEPTNFSFSSSTTFPLPARGTKGPIFEDGPNFDMAFRLFHGQNGVVPLSEGSLQFPQKVKPEPMSQQFNPLAAKAATISLSGFRGSFGFDAFNEMFKNQQKKHKSSNKDSSQKGDSKHEVMGEEWLQSGNCPLAKSYRAVSNVLPLVAKAFKPPSGIKYHCPPAIVAARASLARTAFAKNLRPQPLPAKILAIGLLGMAANVPLGIWREHTEKFSPSWFAAVHAAVPFIGMLRKSVLMPKTAMAFTIAASILGQVIGSRAERYRLKAISARPPTVLTETFVGGFDPTGVNVSASHPAGGRCGEAVEWKSAPLQVAGSSA
ncbi:hypothetical protein L1987_52203 [Smallanthus sonchifolius]|uniref:Uncharacterized protein n=1 Tax=Smallanthus sonchifolius TaxID=185202 RepID=A0ACB9ESV7_9ASTR|nr:hypothetical protein L1987_52203 [Smallanthus sonchifolius]